MADITHTHTRARARLVTSPQRGEPPRDRSVDLSCAIVSGHFHRTTTSRRLTVSPRERASGFSGKNSVSGKTRVLLSAEFSARGISLDLGMHDTFIFPGGTRARGEQQPRVAPQECSEHRGNWEIMHTNRGKAIMTAVKVSLVFRSMRAGGGGRRRAAKRN
jgi:hypothetical protein